MSPPAQGNAISISASVLLHNSGRRASQYLRLMVWRARECSSTGRMRAMAGDSGPVTLPRNVHGATRTCGLFRIRLYLPKIDRVMTYSLPSSSPNHTGVRTAAPFLRNVLREMYFWPG